MKTAEAVIIGGGIVGASIAHYLALKGLRDVVLLERDVIASGATGKSSALIRTHYTNPWDSQMARKSWEVFANWRELIGGECGFTNTGFLFIVGPDEVKKLHQNVEVTRREAGTNTYLLTPGEVKEMLPAWNVGDVGGAAYEPDGGYGDPHSATTSLVRRARELGVSVTLGVAAAAIKVDGDRVAGVDTSKGSILAPTVVLAAGAWSPPIARTAGIELPITGMLLSVGVLERPPQLQEPHPACIDAAQGIYFRSDTGNLSLLGFSSVVDRLESPPNLDPDNYRTEPDSEWTLRTTARMVNRVPAMVNARWRNAWSGVDGNTPDGHAILDRAEGVGGLYLATGMSGTGFKTAPAVGMCMAELITEGAATTVDITPFRLSRFQEDRPLVGQHEYNYYLFKRKG